MDPVTKELMNLVTGLGVGGGPVFAILWFLERRDRRAAWKEHNSLLQTVIESNAQVAGALEKLYTVVTK